MTGAERQTSPARQAMVVLFAALQLVLPAVLTVADGYLELRAPEYAAFSHVESHGTPGCPRVHQEDNCAINHFLSRVGAVKSEGPPAPRVVERIAPFVSSELHQAARRAVLDPSLPRAPPLA